MALPHKHTLTTVLGFAVASAAFSLAVLVPQASTADQTDDLGTMDATKVEHGAVRAKVARDPASRTGWSLVLDVANTGDAPEKCAFKASIERSFVTPMARVASEVTSLVTRTEVVDVAPKQTVHLTREVPAWIAEQLVNSERIVAARQVAEKAWNDSMNAGHPLPMPPAMTVAYPSFRVSVLEPEQRLPKNGDYLNPMRDLRAPGAPTADNRVLPPVPAKPVAPSGWVAMKPVSWREGGVL